MGSICLTPEERGLARVPGRAALQRSRTDRNRSVKTAPCSSRSRVKKAELSRGQYFGKCMQNVPPPLRLGRGASLALEFMNLLSEEKFQICKNKLAFIRNSLGKRRDAFGSAWKFCGQRPGGGNVIKFQMLSQSGTFGHLHQSCRKTATGAGTSSPHVCCWKLMKMEIT